MLRAIFFWTLGCQFIEPINELGIAATLTTETGEDTAAIPLAFLTSAAQHIEPAVRGVSKGLILGPILNVFLSVSAPSA